MKKYLNKVLIIDGSYMMHRAGHTPALEELCTSSGIKSGMIFGFLRILQSEIKKCSGYFPIVCWDKGLSERRTKLYSDYKANRQRLTADSLLSAGVSNSNENEYLVEYHKQRDDLIQLLKYLGIPSLIIPGWEGDDLQYLVSLVTKDGIVLSDDKDMIQLVSPTIKIRRPMKNEIITWDTSDPSYHHPRYTIAKSIVGDTSDNIPKVASGLGGKGADQIAELLKDCNNISEYKIFLESYVQNNSGSLVNKTNKLLNNWDQFIVNYNLIDLHLVEAPPGFEMMIKDLILGVVGKSNLLKAYSIIGKYEMNTIYPDQLIYLVSASVSQIFNKEE